MLNQRSRRGLAVVHIRRAATPRLRWGSSHAAGRLRPAGKPIGPLAATDQQTPKFFPCAPRVCLPSARRLCRRATVQVLGCAQDLGRQSPLGGAHEAPHCMVGLSLGRSRSALQRQESRKESRAAQQRALRLQQHGSLCVHVKGGREIASTLPCFVAVRVPQSSTTSGSSGSTKRYRTVSRLAPEPEWDQYLEVKGVLNVLVSQPLRIEVFEEYCEGDGGARIALPTRRRSVLGTLFAPPPSPQGASDGAATRALAVAPSLAPNAASATKRRGSTGTVFCRRSVTGHSGMPSPAVPRRRNSVIGTLRSSLAAPSPPRGPPRYRRLGSVTLPITDLASMSELTCDDLVLHARGESGAPDAANASVPAAGNVSVRVSFEMDAVGFAFPNPVAATAALAFNEAAPGDAEGDLMPGVHAAYETLAALPGCAEHIRRLRAHLEEHRQFFEPRGPDGEPDAEPQ